MTVIFKRVERFAAHICPTCKREITGLTLRDGDTIMHAPAGRGDYSEYSTMLYIAACPKCGSDMGFVDIGVLSHPKPGSEFIDERGYVAERIELYDVEVAGFSSQIERLINARFDSGHPQYANEVMPWIDLHLIGPIRVSGTMEGPHGLVAPHPCISHDGETLEAWAQARRIVEAVVPALIEGTTVEN